MPIDLPVWVKTVAGWAWPKVKQWGVDRFIRVGVSRTAMDGGDFANEGSLPYLVKLELERLASDVLALPQIRSEPFRNWLRLPSNLDLFSSVLIARAGSAHESTEDTEALLASSFQEATGETSKLASGWINLTISYIYGQLNATDAGRSALQTALDFRNAAHLGRIESLLTPPSTGDVATKVREAATGLLEAGRRSWKMPRSIAPLTLEEHRPDGSGESQRTTIAELASAIDDRRNLILFGSGGIGKTTCLLELCGLCLAAGRRIPLFIDAAVWARSDQSVLDYVAASPAAQVNHATAAELADLAKAGYLVIMLNGWNEISTASKLSCRESLLQLASVAPLLQMVVVSRTATDIPAIDDARQFEILGLTWQGQVDFIRTELHGEQADGLLDLLVRDTRLRHAGRSPLILRGLIAQAKEGPVADCSVFALLGAAVRAFEGDDQRNLILSDQPVDGHHRVYLEEIACDLTGCLLTACSRDEALRSMQSAGKKLMERGVIGTQPNPSTVLATLVSHHLLHVDDGAVRFAHQRFQEYFAATRLLRACDSDAAAHGSLGAICNLPAWDESLMLVAGELKGRPGASDERVKLVKALSAVDLGLACDVAGVCRLQESDDPQLHGMLFERVNQLATSNLQEVRELATTYQVTSRFPEFSGSLWALLESGDMQVRLHAYRMGGVGISLSQLGVDAKTRVAAWPTEHRVEFVHEIAGNADNYEYVVELAEGETDPEVRAAAIAALFWEFRASEVPTRAWLNAPAAVQLNDILLSNVEYALEQGLAGNEVRDRIRAVLRGANSPQKQLRLALAFPEEIDASGLGSVFEHLRGSERQADCAPYVAIARSKDPARLDHLAQELALGARPLHQWVGDYLATAPDRARAELFEKAWLDWQGERTSGNSIEQLGFLANQSQIDGIVTYLLQLDERVRLSPTQGSDDRRILEHLLATATGDDLLAVVLGRAAEASYATACRLAVLVYRRTGAETGIGRKGEWLPTAEQVRQLFEAFGGKQESAAIPQNELKVFLCCIASLVVPDEFETFLLDTTCRYLDAGVSYKEVVEKWSKNPSSPRPQNPYWGNYLTSAWVRVGFPCLQHLVDLMPRPGAIEFVPELIARIVNIPWEAQIEHGTFRSVTSDIQEGRRRRELNRVLVQPDHAQQSVTDEAARVLGKLLTDLVGDSSAAKSEDAKWNWKPAAHQMRRLAGVLANIPSTLVVAPIREALKSELMDVYGVISSLKGLVRQGLVISDASIVPAVEAAYEREAQAQWLDDSTRHAMSEFTQLMFCVSPASLLSRPLDHYIDQWRRFEHINRYIRLLGATPSENACPALIKIGRDVQGATQLDEEFVSILFSALTVKNLPEFLGLVENGMLFRWYRNEWSLRNPPVALARVLEQAGNVSAFLDACRKAGSSLADMLAGRVLLQIKTSDDVLMTYLLSALDAGRAAAPGSSGYQLLKEMFTLKTAIGNGRTESSPKAQNELRAELYLRAKGTGDVANSCRRLLAELESERREAGRPEDEMRHPAIEDGLPWTDVFAGA
ncbi:hypothetical protein P0D69_42660 [Paraburkholderia sediminicola]|uniref:NACHT domain-containing protein n=1 Tax=Paraburkholderia sediminicola TaxID=458836 RepID=UPI0038B7961D